MTLARWAGRTLFALILAIGIVNLRFAWVHRAELRQVTTPVGSVAPDFAVTLLEGKTFKLADAHGKPLAVVFWATWCEPCREELPLINALAQRLGDTARFVAVDIEPAEAKGEVEKFVAEHHLTMPVAYDGSEIAGRYKVESIPHVVVLDGEGKVDRVLSGVHAPAELEAAIKAAASASAK
jgi:thiol-disulfide isomerase/thioredoxin